MQPHLPFSRDPLASSSKLGATLVRLQHHLEANQQREQAALERFESFEHETASQRDVIAERLDSLNLELGQLVPVTSGPRLSLVGQDSEQNDSEQDDEESAKPEAHLAGLASGDSFEKDSFEKDSFEKDSFEKDSPADDCGTDNTESGGTVSFLDFSRGRSQRAD